MFERTITQQENRLTAMRTWKTKRVRILSLRYSSSKLASEPRSELAEQICSRTLMPSRMSAHGNALLTSQL